MKYKLLFMADRKTIIIVGGGISGLSAGIYAEQHGFHAIILEKHFIPGGLCTAWDRKGFTIDGCIHWLTGTKENTILNEMWKNVGAFKEQEDILYLPSWGSFNYKGTEITFWRDLDRAEKEWTEISPVDKKPIHKFFKMVKDFTKVELPLDLPISFFSLGRLLHLGYKVMSVWPSYLLTMKQSCEKYAKKFKSPALRFAFTKAQNGPGNLFSMIYSYATVVIGDGGVPKGGSRPMVLRMAEKFQELGGTLLLNTTVNNVIVEENKAIGVTLQDGTNMYADYTVACLDANYAVKRLLLGQYSLNKIEKKINNPEKFPTPTCCILSYAVKIDENVNTPYSFNVDPFIIGGAKIDHITVRNYAYDKEFNRGDKTIMTVLIDQYSSNYEFWKKLRNSPIEYKKFKLDLGNFVKNRIIENLPQYKDNIELLDVATPSTLSRYTNATRGAYMGFLLTPKVPGFSHNGRIHGLNNFYIGGQWMQSPGGLPIALACGKFSIQRICKKEKLNYVFSPKRVKNKKTNKV